MANNLITLKVKDMFFDRPAVKSRVDRAKRRNISRQLAFLRRRARSVLGRRVKKAKPKPPGEAPRVRTSNSYATLRNILFAYEPTKGSGIIGSVYTSAPQDATLTTGTVPALHEFGGTATFREVRVGTQWRRARRSNSFGRKAERFRSRRVTYSQRPYMAISLAKEIEAGTVDKVWKDSI